MLDSLSGRRRDSVAKVRGTSILGTLAFVRERFGEEAAGRVFAGLAEDHRAALRDAAGGGVALHGWYDTGLLVELTSRIDRELGKGDLALARDMGSHVAFQDVNRFFKWLMRLGGPGILFSRAGAVWNNYYDDGRYVCEHVGDGRASIRIEGSSSAGPVVCKRMEGWIERALEVTLGADKQPVIREEAHLRREAAVGDQAFCRFVAEWRA
jgi:hypothetical protein